MFSLILFGHQVAFLAWVLGWVAAACLWLCWRRLKQWRHTPHLAMRAPKHPAPVKKTSPVPTGSHLYRHEHAE